MNKQVIPKNTIYISRQENCIEGYCMDYSTPQRKGLPNLSFSVYGPTAQEFAENMLKKTPDIAGSRSYEYFNENIKVGKVNIDSPREIERKTIDKAIRAQVIMAEIEKPL